MELMVGHGVYGLEANAINADASRSRIPAIPSGLHSALCPHSKTTADTATQIHKGFRKPSRDSHLEVRSCCAEAAGML